MSTNWTGFAFKRTLVTNVAADATITALSDPTVTVITYWPGERVADLIIIGDNFSDTAEPKNLQGTSGRYEETVDVACQVRAFRPGAGDTVTQSVEDRLRTMLGVVDSQLRTARPSVGDQTTSAYITDRAFAVWAAQAGEVPGVAGKIDFTIRYKARTSN